MLFDTLRTSEISRMFSENKIIGTADGNNITVQDSAGAPFSSLVVDGKSEQIQYSGKNLLEVTKFNTITQLGMTYTPVYDENGLLKYINVNGTCTGNYYFLDLGVINLESGNYIVSFEGNNGVITQVFATKTDGTTEYLYSKSMGEEIEITYDTSIYTELKARMYVTNGTTINNANIKPMIRKAEITDNTYEPYVGGIPSPNPDYPQAINSVADSGSIEVVSCGKNIFGGLALAQAIVNSGSNNVTLDENAKTISYKQNSNYKDDVKRVLFSNFKENTQYSIILNGSIVNNTNLIIIYTDGTNEWIKTVNNVFKTNINKTVQCIEYSYADEQITTLNYEKCGLFEGVITMNDFEPYICFSATLALDSLRSLPNGVKDELVFNADGTGKIIRRVGLHTVNVTSLTTTSKGYKAYVCELSDKAIMNDSELVTQTNSLCDRSSYDIAGGSNTYHENPYNFVFRGTSDDTLETFKAKYDGAVLLYRLATPTEEELTAEQISEILNLRTYESVSNINTTDSLQPNLEVEYYKNTNAGKTVSKFKSNEATEVHSGLMPTSDKSKLNGIGYMIGYPFNIPVTSSHTYSTTGDLQVSVATLRETIQSVYSGDLDKIKTIIVTDVHNGSGDYTSFIADTGLLAYALRLVKENTTYSNVTIGKIYSPVGGGSYTPVIELMLLVEI